MYKLNIGVGYSIFEAALNPFGSCAGIFQYIDQHRVILNETIINYYFDNIPEAFEDQLDTYINSIIVDDRSYSSAEKSIDPKQNIIDSVTKVPYRVLLSRVEEFGGYNCNKIDIVTPENIFNSDDNVFNKFTFPLTNYVAKAGSNCGIHAAWFGRLFENEGKIEIVDPYIFSDDGREILKRYVLPQIEEGTNIEIYCFCYTEKENLATEKVIQNMIHGELSGWNIRVHLCSKIHDRFLNLSSLQISLGKGFDFLNLSGEVIEDHIISVSKGKPLPLPREYRCIC